MKHWSCQPYCTMQIRGLLLNDWRQLIIGGNLENTWNRMKRKNYKRGSHKKDRHGAAGGYHPENTTAMADTPTSHGAGADPKANTQLQLESGILSGRKDDRELTGQPRSKRSWKALECLRKKAERAAEDSSIWISYVARCEM